jgi:hypothetical protein
MTVYDLWLPILCAGIATHILSTLAWTVMPHHRPEWNSLTCEDEFQDFLAKKGIAPNQYIFPHAGDGSKINTEEFKSKAAKSSGTLVIWPTPTNMLQSILKTLAYFFVVAFVIGYLASQALPAGAPFLKVFQFVMTAGLLAYVSANFPYVFWFRRRIAMEVLDGVVFSLAAGLVFALLWPK